MAQQSGAAQMSLWVMAALALYLLRVFAGAVIPWLVD